MPLEEAALVAGTQQNLSNLLFLDIYAYNQPTQIQVYSDVAYLHLHPVTTSDSDQHSKVLLSKVGHLAHGLL